ncbi:Gfo/Idh/MocA family protein [Rhizobium sp. X9]|uniref:Gfo/Idh/MocA family protein n=1 Tax=Rhizobium sp. X9 TaxID=2815360 RepID=UPI001C0BBC09|nr:Gfo/Idh/MocA family oxidoreductase [Rhizobium sp. X9]
MAMKIGVIGCGNISDAYLTNGPLFRDIEYVACSDLNAELAGQKAAKYGLEPMPIDELFARDDIEAILNLTVPNAHAEVALRAIAAGKHVYNEKPLAVSLREGREIIDAAKVAGVRVGSAPDTVLGPGIQTARSIIDSGDIGSVISGLGAVESYGMEHWHPTPSFFYKGGGGPVLDMGPYYISALVHMLGPVTTVQASGSVGHPQRVVKVDGPTKGTVIDVETLTTVQALLTFASGAQIVFLASWDVWNSELRPLQLHSTGGTLHIPDPNQFSGVVGFSTGIDDFREIDTSKYPFGAYNRDWRGTGSLINTCYRGLGLADMAVSITEGVPHRCSAEVAYHVLEVLLAIERAAHEKVIVSVESTCERPAVLTPVDAKRFLKGPEV